MKTPPINTKIIATLPVLVSVGLVSILIRSYDLTAYFSAFILGIIAGGLVDLDNGLTGRLKNIGITLLCFAISSLAVQLTIAHPILFTLTITVLAFGFTLMGAAGPRYRTIAFGTVAVSVYTMLAHHDDVPWFLTTAFMLSGTLLYSGLTLFTHLIFPHRPVQENMATAYTALADYLDAKAAFFDPDEADYLEEQQVRLALSNTQVIHNFNACRSSLFYRMRGQHRHPRTVKMLRYYFIAQDIHERISSSHVRYQIFAAQMQYSDLIFRIRRLLELQARACRCFARELRDSRETYRYPPQLHRASKGIERSLKSYMQQHEQDSEAVSIKRLADNILHVSRQLSYLNNPDTEFENEITGQEQSRIVALERGGLAGAWQAVRSQLSFDSSVFRHSIRLALLVLASSVVAFGVGQSTGSEHPAFWILLTAIFVCQPNYSTTKNRLVQRILGTVAGVLVGSLLPYFPLTLDMKFAIVAVATTLFFFFRSNKHSFSTFFITIQALMSFSIMGFDMSLLFFPRIVETVLGTLLAGGAVYFLWPDWNYLALDKTAFKAIRSQGGYLQAILKDLENGHNGDSPDYRLARRESHENAAALSSTLSDMTGEPKKYAESLADGLLLLKINYSLISYISALGAYRRQMHTHETDLEFLNRFFPIAYQISDLLTHIHQIKNETFQAALNQIRSELNEIKPEYSGGDGQSNVLWQQLVMIAELLPPCRRVLYAC